MRARLQALAVVPLLLFSSACEPPPPDEPLAPEDRRAIDMLAEDREATELTPEDREAIEALTEAYADRSLAGDLDGWADLYHPDAVRMHPGTPDWEGRDGIRGWVETVAPSAIHQVELSAVEVEGTGQLAYMRGTYRVGGTLLVDDDEVRVRDEGSWLAVVRRDEDDHWRFYRWAHNSNLPQAPAPADEE